MESYSDIRSDSSSIMHSSLNKEDNFSGNSTNGPNDIDEEIIELNSLKNSQEI